MLGYWILIVVPILFSFLSIRKKAELNSLCFVVGLFYFLFIGLRFEVGADRWAYQGIYDNITTLPYNYAILYTEPGFATLNWLLGQIDAGIYWVNVVVAMLFVTGIIRFAKTTPSPWIALVSVTPYLVIAIALSATRQSAAIGLVFHLMASWRQNLLTKLILSFVAITFHYSAVMALVFLQQSIKMPIWLRAAIILAASIAAYPVLTATDEFVKYQHTYLENNIVSYGALQHVLLNAIPAVIYFIFWRKWKVVFGKSDLLPMLSVLSIISIFGVSVSSTGIDRLALYLSPIQMIVYGSLPYLFGKRNKITVSLAIIGVHLLIMFWWLNYANTASGFIPYDNLIIQEMLK